jgi:hypothetical protein
MRSSWRRSRIMDGRLPVPSSVHPLDESRRLPDYPVRPEAAHFALGDPLQRLDIRQQRRTSHRATFKGIVPAFDGAVSVCARLMRVILSCKNELFPRTVIARVFLNGGRGDGTRIAVPGCALASRGGRLAKARPCSYTFADIGRLTCSRRPVAALSSSAAKPRWRSAASRRRSNSRRKRCRSASRQGRVHVPA